MVHLSAADAPHLVKLAAALATDAPVKPTKTGVALVLNSKRLVESLAPLGIIPRKSYSGFPWTGPARLMRHYWRGVVDGDGHISKTKPLLALAGTNAVICAFLKFASEICGTSAVPCRQPKSAAWHVLLTGGRMVPKVIRELYECDGPALDRKKAAAIALLGRYPPRAVRTCSFCQRRAVARSLCGKHYQSEHSAGRLAQHALIAPR